MTITTIFASIDNLVDAKLLWIINTFLATVSLLLYMSIFLTGVMKLLIELLLILDFLLRVSQLIHSELGYRLGSSRMVQKSVPSHIVVVDSCLFQLTDSLIECAVDKSAPKDRYSRIPSVMKESATDTSIPEDVAGDQICYHGDKAG